MQRRISTVPALPKLFHTSSRGCVNFYNSCIDTECSGSSSSSRAYIKAEPINIPIRPEKVCERTKRFQFAYGFGTRCDPLRSQFQSRGKSTRFLWLKIGMEKEISGISCLVDGVIHSSNINYSTKALHFDMQEHYNSFEYRIVFALW